jgi:hypothetical protein
MARASKAAPRLPPPSVLDVAFEEVTPLTRAKPASPQPERRSRVTPGKVLAAPFVIFLATVGFGCFLLAAIGIGFTVIKVFFDLASIAAFILVGVLSLMAGVKLARKVNIID